MFSYRTVAQGSIRQYICHAELMYQSSQGIFLSNIISINDIHIFNPSLIKWDAPTLIQETRKVSIGNVLFKHLWCLRLIHSRDFYSAFLLQCTCVQDVVKILRNQRGANWMLPVMYTVAADLRWIAEKAYGLNRHRSYILSAATTILIQCYRVCVADLTMMLDPRNSKVKGALSAVNQILYLYFMSHSYKLCQILVNAVDEALDRIPSTMAQRVSYKFIAGRLAMVKGNYSTAERNFTYAFEYCNPEIIKNGKHVLKYLLLVKMLMGYMPTKATIDKYGLPHYWDLLTAVNRGNLKTFDMIRDEHRLCFRDMELFLAIENLRVLTVRNVFEMVYHKMQDHNEISVYHFQAGLQMKSGEAVAHSKTRSLIATLIDQNKMKACLSYSRDMVYFLDDNVFPPIGSVASRD